MSVHLSEYGYDPDLDYNMLVETHGSAGPKKQSDAERVAERDLAWARALMGEDCVISADETPQSGTK